MKWKCELLIILEIFCLISLSPYLLSIELKKTEKVLTSEKIDINLGRLRKKIIYELSGENINIDKKKARLVLKKLKVQRLIKRTKQILDKISAGQKIKTPLVMSYLKKARAFYTKAVFFAKKNKFQKATNFLMSSQDKAYQAARVMRSLSGENIKSAMESSAARIIKVNYRFIRKIKVLIRKFSKDKQLDYDCLNKAVIFHKKAIKYYKNKNFRISLNYSRITRRLCLYLLSRLKRKNKIKIEN